ncbi:MAG: adenylyltransferase/cytidyltransferase family protein [bacterium]|nr:adenylyltransferase/cytidyltransferase family protein [bacterium]
MENKKIGFTIGKFAPLHKGHQFLIETALKEMDEVIVVIYDTDLIDTNTESRAKWIKDIYPDVKILIAKNPPNQYGLDRESVKIQMEYLLKIIDGIKPTHFYSSEPYGKYVADYMKIIDRRVDDNREKVPIRASTIRNNLEKNKKWIANNVYSDLKRGDKK